MFWMLTVYTYVQPTESTCNHIGTEGEGDDDDDDDDNDLPLIQYHNM
jgi:hypothetical protein